MDVGRLLNVPSSQFTDTKFVSHTSRLWSDAVTLNQQNNKNLQGNVDQLILRIKHLPWKNMKVDHSDDRMELSLS